jgi:DegV family protein with EDD domain
METVKDNMTIKIVTDSTCDLPQEVIDELDISVVPCYINFPDKSYLDGVEITRKEFYDKLPNYDPPPTTSAPAIGTFVKVYNDLAKKGATGILSIHISSALSGIYNVAVLASEAVEKVVVKTFDAGQLSLGTGMVVETVARAAKAGSSLDKLLQLAKDVSARTFTFAAVDTLKYLQRSGRVSHIKATLGSLLQIKPILQMHQAKIEMGAARTLKGSMDHLLQILKSLGPLERVGLVHTNAIERTEQLFDLAAPLLPDKIKHYTVDVTPVLGSHLGPGMFGFVVVQQ